MELTRNAVCCFCISNCYIMIFTLAADACQKCVYCWQGCVSKWLVLIWFSHLWMKSCFCQYSNSSFSQTDLNTNVKNLFWHPPHILVPFTSSLFDLLNDLLTLYAVRLTSWGRGGKDWDVCAQVPQNSSRVWTSSLSAGPRATVRPLQRHKSFRFGYDVNTKQVQRVTGVVSQWNWTFWGSEHLGLLTTSHREEFNLDYECNRNKTHGSSLVESVAPLVIYNSGHSSWKYCPLIFACSCMMTPATSRTVFHHTLTSPSATSCPDWFAL